MSTPNRRLAGHLLGQPVEPWLRAKRAEGLSYRSLAVELCKATGGQVDVSGQALINWLAEDPALATIH